MCGCGEWGNTAARMAMSCASKQVKMHCCLCSFDGHGGGGDYSEDEQLDDPDEAQVCVCVCVGRRGFMGVGVTTARMSSWMTLMKCRCVRVWAGEGSWGWTCYVSHPVSLLAANLTGLKCSIPVRYGGHQSSSCSDHTWSIPLTAELLCGMHLNPKASSIDGWGGRY